VCAACPGRAVELVTARALAAGDALTLDYGARPLRALLQGYAFVPADAAFASPSEVRPAPSAPCGPGTCDAWASERRAADPRALLPTRAFIHGALLAQIIGYEPRWDGPDGGRACGDAAARALDPSMEAALAARLANNIGVALAAAPTSLAADAVALAALAGGPAGCAGGSAAEPGHAPCPGSCAECAQGGGGREASERCACGPECTHARARDRQGAARACGGGAPGVCRSASGAHAPGEGRDGEECGPGAAAMWRARAHAVLAARYRLERKRLLARVASDLRCQAALAR